MWLTGLAFAFWAADEPASAGTGVDQLAVIIGGIATAFIGGIVAVTVALINSRANRTAPSPPSPTVVQDAETRRRLDDGDEARDMQDRRLERHERAMDRFGDRLERIEGHLDRADPGWRRGN